MRGPLYLCLAFLIISMLSCTSRPVATRLELTGSREVLDAVTDRSSAIHLLEADGTLSFESPDESGDAAFELQYLRPDTVWLKMTGPFGISVGTLLLTHSRFSYYDARKDRLFSGPSTAESFAKLFSIPLSYRAIVDGILGAGFGALSSAEHGDITINERDYILHRLGDGGESHVRVDGARFIVTGYDERDMLGRSKISAAASRIESVNGLSMPYLLRYSLPMQERGLTIMYRRIKINEPRRKKFFLPQKNAGEVDADGFK